MALSNVFSLADGTSKIKSRRPHELFIIHYIDVKNLRELTSKRRQLNESWSTLLIYLGYFEILALMERSTIMDSIENAIILSSSCSNT